MSSESVIKYGERYISALPLTADAFDSITTLLGQADHSIIQLMYELGLHCGLSHNTACSRVLPVLIQNIAIHLADDLADGDCHYLEPAVSQGATALFTLQQIFGLSLRACALSPDIEESIYTLLSRVGAAQHSEINTKHWTLEKSKQAALGLNGCQFEAYFTIVTACSSSPIAARIPALGHAYGICNHLANDIMSNDPRYTQLSLQDKATIKSWTMEYVKQLIDEDIKPLTQRLSALLRHLR